VERLYAHDGQNVLLYGCDDHDFLYAGHDCGQAQRGDGRSYLGQLLRLHLVFQLELLFQLSLLLLIFLMKKVYPIQQLFWQKLPQLLLLHHQNHQRHQVLDQSLHHRQLQDYLYHQEHLL